MPSKRYAEGTTVTVESSRGEITGILAKHGVVRQAMASEPERDILQFELAGRRFQLVIDRPDLATVRRMYPNAYNEQAKLDGEWRRRWRATVLLLKAKLEFADGETSTIERELLPYMLTASGQTIEEAIAAGGVKMLAAKN